MSLGAVAFAMASTFQGSVVLVKDLGFERQSESLLDWILSLRPMLLLCPSRGVCVVCGVRCVVCGGGGGGGGGVACGVWCVVCGVCVCGVCGVCGVCVGGEVSDI